MTGQNDSDMQPCPHDRNVQGSRESRPSLNPSRFANVLLGDSRCYRDIESKNSLGACCNSVNCGVNARSAHRYGPKMRNCALRRPDFCHFEGFRLPIRWISRAIGLLQQALRRPSGGDVRLLGVASAHRLAASKASAKSILYLPSTSSATRLRWRFETFEQSTILLCR